MYPWERVIPSQDSTLRIIHEAVKRGHEVSITHPSNLTIRESDKKERKTIVNDYETEFVCCYYITSTNDPKIKNTILDKFKNLDLNNLKLF